MGSTNLTAESEATNTPTGGSGNQETVIVSSDKRPSNSGEGNRTDMPVSAVARLLGVATQTDLTLIEGKVDLLLTKLNLMQVRVEKVLTSLAGMPSGADLERIDVQIGSLKSALRDALGTIASDSKEPSKKKAEPAVAAAAPRASTEEEPG